MADKGYEPLAAKAAFGLRDLLDAMVENGDMDPEKFQYQIMARKARKQIAKELHEKGVPKTKIAKLAGVDEATIRRDLKEIQSANAELFSANADESDPIQEPCEDCETVAEHWQRSLENLAGDAISIRSYWNRQFDKWENFDVPDTTINLAKQAAREWTELVRDLEQRRRQKNAA